jgi:DNA polymerase elongation subunit (family B)
MIQRTKNEIETRYPGSRIIYGDTDSVFVDFQIYDPAINGNMHELFKFAESVSKDLTRNLFKAPHDLEFEKVFLPLFLLMKKRYFGMKYTDPNKDAIIENRGVVLQKRDTCPLVHETFAFCQEKVLKNTTEGVKEALDEIKKQLNLLAYDNNDIDVRKFVKVVGYRGDYADPNKLPHSHAAQVMKHKDNIEVCKGDKIEFLITLPKFEKGPVNKRISERAYDIGHYNSCGRHKIDGGHYIDLLEQPISQFMTLVAPDEIKQIFQQARMDFLRHRDKNESIKSNFLCNHNQRNRQKK